MDTLLLPAFQKLLTMPFPQLEVRRRSRHYYGARVYAQDEVPLATRLVGWPSLPSEIATRVHDLFIFVHGLFTIAGQDFLVFTVS